MGLIEFSFCAAAEREILSDANEKSSYINLRSTISLRNIIILHDLGWSCEHLVWIFLLLAVHHLWPNGSCWKYCSGQSSRYEEPGSMTFLLSVTACNVDIRRVVRPCRVNSGTTMSPEILNA